MVIPYEPQDKNQPVLLQYPSLTAKFYFRQYSWAINNIRVIPGC